MSEGTLLPINIGEFQAVLSPVITVAEIFDLPDNFRVTILVEHTFSLAREARPLAVLADVYVDVHEDGYIANSVDHDFNISSVDDNMKFWVTLGSFVNRQRLTRNVFEVLLQLTNTTGDTHDYFIDYVAYYLRRD